MSIASVALALLAAALLLAGFILATVGLLAASYRPLRERLSVASPLLLAQRGSLLFFLGWLALAASRLL